MNKGKLIIFEGPDFSGKSTQIKLLKPALIKNNNILYTREPGSYLPDTQAYCEQIRDFILNHKLPVGQEAALFAESRFAHTQEMVRHINEGYNVKVKATIDKYDTDSGLLIISVKEITQR